MPVSEPESDSVAASRTLGSESRAWPVVGPIIMMIRGPGLPARGPGQPGTDTPAAAASACRGARPAQAARPALAGPELRLARADSEV